MDNLWKTISNKLLNLSRYSIRVYFEMVLDNGKSEYKDIVSLSLKSRIVASGQKNLRHWVGFVGFLITQTYSEVYFLTMKSSRRNNTCCTDTDTNIVFYKKIPFQIFR